MNMDTHSPTNECATTIAARRTCGVPRAPRSQLLGRTSVWTAWLVVALAALHPPHGLGVQLCLFHATTGAPCWGCGLSRSLSCSLRGMLGEAWAYHPFGPILLIALVGIAITSLLCPCKRERIAAQLDSHPRVTTCSYAVWATMFLAFGTMRAVLHLL